MLMNLLVQIGLSLVFVIIGHSMVKGNIKWLHSYHRKRIEKKDEPIVGKWCGMGLYVIALGIFSSGIFTYIGKEEWISFILIPTLVIGIGMNFTIIIKYNGGLF